MKETIIASSALILCIMLIRRLCKERISACLQYALWLIVALRLIIPGIAVIFPDILPRSDLSIMNAAYSMAHSIQPEETADYENISGEMPVLTAEDEGGAIVTLLTAVGTPAWKNLIRAVWYLGAAAAGLWIVSVNIVFAHRLRKGRIRYEKEGLELPLTLPIYLVKDLPSPCLYGAMGRQAIYLPEYAAEDDEKIRHILAHEYCHYKHRDIFWSALRCVIVAIYWFHPLVWVAAVMSKQDCELACDEAAIKLLGESERVAYGKTLVSLIIRKAKASDIVCAATTMTGGAESIKERISRITKKPHRLVIVLIPVIVAVGVMTAITFTQAKEYPDGAVVIEGENAIIVTTDCFRVTFPEDIAEKAYYRSENGTDIIVYYKYSDMEVGRLCRLSYDEAAQLADEREIVPIGSYGSNYALSRRLSGYADIETTHEYTYDVIEHEYTYDVNEQEYTSDEIIHEYTSDNTSEYTPAGVAGIDSNDDTTYILPDEDAGSTSLPVASETTYLPDEKVVERAGTSDYLPNEKVDESASDYLPNERIEVTYVPSLSNAPCYIYIPADISDAGPEIQAQLSEMNRSIIGLLDYVSVLSVSEESMQEALDTMLANRNPYVGDNVKTSCIAEVIPTTEKLTYQYLSMETTAEPYEVTIYYNMNGSFDKADSDMMFTGTVMMLASIENLAQCNIQIRDMNNSVPAGTYTEYHYSREDMEELFGPLYPCSETKESFIDLYNRVLEYLKN